MCADFQHLLPVAPRRASMCSPSIARTTFETSVRFLIIQMTMALAVNRKLPRVKACELFHSLLAVQFERGEFHLGLVGVVVSEGV